MKVISFALLALLRLHLVAFADPGTTEKPTDREEVVGRIMVSMLAQGAKNFQQTLLSMKKENSFVPSDLNDFIELDGILYPTLVHLLVSYPKPISERSLKFRVLKSFGATYWSKRELEGDQLADIVEDGILGSLLFQDESADNAKILTILAGEVQANPKLARNTFAIVSFLIMNQKFSFLHAFVVGSKLDFFAIAYEGNPVADLLAKFGDAKYAKSVTFILDHICSQLELAAKTKPDDEKCLKLRTQIGEMARRDLSAEASLKLSAAIFALMRYLVSKPDSNISETSILFSYLPQTEEAWNGFLETDELKRNIFHSMLEPIEGQNSVMIRSLQIAGTIWPLYLKRRKAPDVKVLLRILLRRDGLPLEYSFRERILAALDSKASVYIGSDQAFKPIYMQASPLALAAIMGYKGFLGEAISFLADDRRYDSDLHRVQHTSLSELLDESERNFGAREQCLVDECWQSTGTRTLYSDSHDFLPVWRRAETAAKALVREQTVETIITPLRAELAKIDKETDDQFEKMGKLTQLLARELTKGSYALLCHVPATYRIALFGNCLIELLKYPAAGFDEKEVYGLKEEDLVALVKAAEIKKRFSLSEAFSQSLIHAIYDAIHTGGPISYTEQRRRESSISRAFGRFRSGFRGFSSSS